MATKQDDLTEDAVNKHYTSALAVLLMLLGTAPVLAQTSSIIDHYTLTLGTYLSSQDSTLRVDGEGGTEGTPIEFENTFGLDDTANLARFGFDWRIGNRHQVSLGGYRTSRENSKRITRDIEFNGEVFPVDTVVSGKLSTTFYDLAYTYYPYLREDRAFGITGGLVTMSMSAKLKNEPQSGGSTAEIDARTSANLPAPGLGISYRQRFGEHWRFDTRASFLPKITIDKWNAKTANLNAAIEYRFLDHYSVGAAYDYFSFTVGVDATDVDFSGSFKYKIQGPQGFVRFFW